MQGAPCRGREGEKNKIAFRTGPKRNRESTGNETRSFRKMDVSFEIKSPSCADHFRDAATPDRRRHPAEPERTIRNCANYTPPAAEAKHRGRRRQRCWIRPHRRSHWCRRWTCCFCCCGRSEGLGSPSGYESTERTGRICVLLVGGDALPRGADLPAWFDRHWLSTERPHFPFAFACLPGRHRRSACAHGGPPQRHVSIACHPVSRSGGGG